MRIFLILLFSILSLVVYAQQEHGDVLENFRLTNAIDNTEFDLQREYNHKILALVFFSHDCPFSKIYIERIIKMAKNYSERDVFFVIINPNSSSRQAGTMEAMKKYAEHFPFPFPYLADPDKLVASKLEVTKTPSVYLFKNIYNKYVLEYKGAIDDAPEKEKNTTEHYLLKAINALLNNKSFKHRYTDPVGCVVK